MEKTIFSKKHAIIKFSLVLLLVFFAFSFAMVQALELTARAEETENTVLESEYGFDYDLGDYQNGTFLRIRDDNYPEFTLTFKSKTNVADKRFWYGVSETANVEDVELWTLASQYEVDADGKGVGTIYVDSFARDEANSNGGIFQKYVFFRSGSVSGEGPFYYDTESMVDLRIDNNASDDVYEIDSLIATYKPVGEAEKEYDLFSSTKNWTSSPITLRVTNDSGKYDNANFYYQLGENEPIEFEKKYVDQEGSATKSYYGEAVIPSSSLEAYEGELTVYSTSKASTSDRIVYNAGKPMNVYYDAKEPSFTVTAKMGDEYYVDNDGSWSNRNITYILDNDAVLSGATYKCEVTINRVTETYEVQLQGDQYSYTVSNEGITSIKFYAVSGSGVQFHAPTTTARIDKVKPALSVSATDEYGAEIRSMGTSAGDYRVGYARDSVTFVLANLNVQQQGNLATYEYSYDGENYVKIESTNDNYQKKEYNTEEDKIVNKTFYFRITTKSGEVDVKEFTLSVLDSNYSVVMEPEYPVASGGGWIADPVPVKFTLPKILGIENEYEIYGMVTGAPDTSKKLETSVVSSTIDKITYEVVIDVNLNNNSYTFEIYDKAQNKGGCVYGENGIILEETVYKTIQLKLDLTLPSADIVRTINGTSIVLASDDDWSAGEVLIAITPTAQLSGVTCYPIIDGIKSSVPMEMVGGIFSKVVSEGGLYEFELVSGAEKKQVVSCQVNIDKRKAEDVTLDDVIVSTIDKDGNVIVENLDYTNPTLMVANDLKVEFDTPLNYLEDGVTVAKHFKFYYAVYTGSEPTVDESGYTLFVPQVGQDAYSFVIKMPAEGGSGKVQYAFYLESKAMDTNGDLKRTDVKYFSISYDVRDFAIEVNYNGLGIGDQWVGTAPQFSLSLHRDTTENITIAEYQYRLSSTGEWITIPGTASNKVDFEFEGVENKVEGIDDLRSLDEDNTFASFNGTIYFRALNSAGHASPTLEVDVKMDTSTPNPLYAVNQLAGEIVFNESSRVYSIYSNATVTYRKTGGDVSPVFLQKAGITYYISNSDATDTESNIENIYDTSVWTVLSDTKTLESGSYYWIVANNGMRMSSAYKIYVNVDTVLSANLLGGNIGSQEGVLEYNWTQDRAEIQFEVESNSAFYIWYSLDNSEWAKVEEWAVPVSGTTTFWNISFVAPSTDGSIIEEDFVIVGNLKATARFKVTNLAGSELVLRESAIIRIDNESPKFNLSLATTSGAQVTTEDLSKYFSETIHIRIDADAYNPGGVEYTYRVEGASNYEKMAGTRISTDEILGFEGNGTLRITFRAQAYASLKVHEETLTLYIDKILPDFELKGEVYKNGMATGQKISSGTWTNADEILISRVVDKVPVSGVTYTIATTNEPEKNWEAGTPVSIKEISTVTVVATSGSGLVVRKVFDVNIDNVAPIIHAGPIVNNDLDPQNPYRYYIDQKITYTENNVASATYNGFPLPNGHVIATNTVDNSKDGFVHIVVVDKAGNKAELRFYMTVFDLTVNNIEINDDHIALLNAFEASYEDALNQGSLSNSRAEHFKTMISRLWDRLATLEKEVADYQAYLTQIEQRVTFDLISDYGEMEKYLAYFLSEDPLIVYPEWQQNKIKEGIYESYYAKLVSEFSKLDAHMSVVRNLQKQVISLPATNIVEEGDYQEVIRVYNAYQSLSNDQKAVFSPNLFTKLLELKRICEVYRLQDEDTGISIDGDHLVGEGVGVMLEVVNYAETTELYINAQKTLYETVSEGNPRKIISINKLGMTGYGSQYDTGEIKITLPIPSEGETDYTQYVYFAVYRLSTDGTLSPVKDVMRSRDGKSVYFYSTQLDTYALATTANVVVREEPEKIYGSVAGIEIDATLLTYITFAVIAMFVVFVVIILLVAIRRRKFLRAYNRDHKNALQRRGITRIPKGNAPPISNPARPEERVGDTSAVYLPGKRRRKR